MFLVCATIYKQTPSYSRFYGIRLIARDFSYIKLQGQFFSLAIARENRFLLLNRMGAFRYSLSGFEFYKNRKSGKFAKISPQLLKFYRSFIFLSAVKVHQHVKKVLKVLRLFCEHFSLTIAREKMWQNFLSQLREKIFQGAPLNIKLIKYPCFILVYHSTGMPRNPRHWRIISRKHNNKCL